MFDALILIAAIVVGVLASLLLLILLVLQTVLSVESLLMQIMQILNELRKNDTLDRDALAEARRRTRGNNAME